MDEYFEWFLEKFGKPTYTEAVSEATFNKFRGKLPNQLLEYWKEVGFCGFRDGLFWMTNPDEYESALEAWIGDTPIMEKDAYYVIARSGFGDLFLWGTKTGDMYKITPYMGWIYEGDSNSQEIQEGHEDFCMQKFFSVRKPEPLDINDENGVPLFHRAVEKLGPLGPDEMFAFAPALALGGAWKLENLTKVDIHVQLDLLAQLVPREIVDRQGLTRKAFGG